MWWILVAMGCSLGLILLDETVVGVALPSIRNDLKMSALGSHWVVNSYLLVFACLIAVGGKLGDTFGLRRIFFLGLLIFGLASLASGFAQNSVWILSTRALQGVGGALLIPISMAMVSAVFPLNQRGLALGLYSAIGTIFLATGPMIGGFFSEYISWRWIFWINLPVLVGIFSVVLLKWDPKCYSLKTVPIDFIGLVLLVLGLCALVMGIMQGEFWGWGSVTILSLLIGGGLILGIFTWVELKEPRALIEVRLFQNLTFTASNLAVFLAQFQKSVTIIFGALFIERAFHWQPFAAGLALLPSVAPPLFLASTIGKWSDRYNSRWLTLTGIFGTVLGQGVMAWSAFRSSFSIFILGLLLMGFGVSFLFSPPRRAILNAVPLEKHGQASGIAYTCQMLGATLGVAMSSAILSATNHYGNVFLGATLVGLLILIIGYFSLERA